jgi:hypothetical protein
MTLAASALMITLLAPAGVGNTPNTSTSTPAAAPMAAPAIRIAAEPTAQLDVRSNPLAAPRWAFDAKRPSALPAMYAGLGVLQALAGGATELNPVLAPGAKNTAVMAAVKGASTALSIYFVERTWKRNRKGAVVLMGIINGVTAAVVAKNLHNAR